jgi:predicted  nucleic acid-binding Zn-ribbon protein
LLSEHEATNSALNIHEKKALKLQTEVEELEGTIYSLKTKISDLRNYSIQNGGALISLKSKYDELSEA